MKVEALTDCIYLVKGENISSFPYMEPLLRLWESQMIGKHLKQLKTDGRVKKQGNLYIKG